MHADTMASMQQTDHACARILPDKGVPQDLGEFTGSERSVDLVSTKSPDTLLEKESGQKTGLLNFCSLFKNRYKSNLSIKTPADEP